MIKKNISLFALIVLLLALSGCSNNKSQRNENINDTQPSSTTGIVSSTEMENIEDSITDSANKNATSNVTTDPKRHEKDIQKGEVEIDIVLPEGGNVETRIGNLSDIDLNRPTSLNGSKVFDGWRQEELISQIMDGSDAKEIEITLTADAIDISNSDNVIYNDVTYVNSGMDSISIPVTVGGNTNFAILELEISYDTSLLEFESFTSKDTDVECNCPEPGLIYVSFVSTDNVSADIELCNIQFKNISAEGTETLLKYNIKDLAAWNSDKTDYIDVNHEVINSRIVMF